MCEGNLLPGAEVSEVLGAAERRGLAGGSRLLRHCGQAAAAPASCTALWQGAYISFNSQTLAPYACVCAASREGLTFTVTFISDPALGLAMSQQKNLLVVSIPGYLPLVFL